MSSRERKEEEEKEKKNSNQKSIELNQFLFFQFWKNKLFSFNLFEQHSWFNFTTYKIENSPPVWFAFILSIFVKEKKKEKETKN